MTGLEKMLAIDKDQLKDDIIMCLNVNPKIENLIAAVSIFRCPCSYNLRDSNCNTISCKECWDIALVEEVMGEEI